MTNGIGTQQSTMLEHKRNRSSKGVGFVLLYNITCGLKCLIQDIFPASYALGIWNSLFWSVLQLIIDSLPILTSLLRSPIRSNLSSQFPLFLGVLLLSCSHLYLVDLFLRWCKRKMNESVDEETIGSMSFLMSCLHVFSLLPLVSSST